MFAVIDQLSYQLPDLVDNKVSFLLSQLLSKLVANLQHLQSYPSALHFLIFFKLGSTPSFIQGTPKLPQASTNLFPVGLC